MDGLTEVYKYKNEYIVYLEKTDCIDSSGLRLLLGVHGMATSRGIRKKPNHSLQTCH